MALQGVSALLLSYRRFLKVSNALQVAAFFTILGVYFLTPGPSELELTPGGALPAFVGRLPSFWFVGLFERWNGSSNGLFEALSMRAVIALVASIP